MPNDLSRDSVQALTASITHAIALAEGCGLTSVAASLEEIVFQFRPAEAEVDDEPAADAMPQPVHVSRVPLNTRWAFKWAGCHFQFCTFRVLGDDPETDVPVTLLWETANGGRGRRGFPDVQTAFAYAAEIAATPRY